MAIPAWFDPNAYFLNKLAQLGEGWNSLTLTSAFNNAGYAGEEGRYQHFLDYGAREGVSPNALFNNDEYLYSKAVEYYHTSSVTENHIASMKMLFAEAGMSAWEHYVQWGAFEKDGSGNYTNNPSTGFWTNQYMLNKLNLWNAETGETHTMAELEAAFIAAGLTPLQHYLLYGQDEGLSASVAPTGRSFSLTTGDDQFLGSSGNDYIYGRINTLQDGDFINGGGGTNDTLYAHLTAQNGQNAIIQPWIWNVENIIFRVQASGSNPGNLPEAQVDATDIVGMTYLKNDNSRATLSVEDVRTNSNEMTIAWADSDAGRMVDFEVYFDAQHLKAGEAITSGTLRIELMDVKNSQAQGVHSLQENIWNTFTFTYTASDGTEQDVSLTAATGYTGATATIETLLAAFQADLAASQWAGLFTLSLESTTYTGIASSGGQSWSFADGHRIVITAANGSLEPVRWSTDGESTVPPSGGISWGYLEASQSTCPLILTTIELDNVGRVQWTDASGDCLPDESIWGSESGDMIVGSMADRGGIERFDVKVDRGSWLSSLSSTNETLRMVTVEHRDINGDGKAGYNELAHANDEGRGQLYIGKSLAAGADDNLMTWTDRASLLSTDGLVDVKNFEAAAFEGKLNIGASITDQSFEKYLNDVDGKYSMANKYAPRGEFLYDFGSNDDTLNMTVNSGIAADRDFTLVINGNAGDDLVNFNYTGLLTSNQYSDMIALKNVVINGGDGSDTIKVWGEDVTARSVIQVNGGAGNDAIYVGQLMDGSTAGDLVGEANAVWLYNVDNSDPKNLGIYVDNMLGAQALNNDALSTFRTALLTPGAADQSFYVQVTFKGFASQYIKIGDYKSTSTTAMTVSTNDINLAIIQAINDDPVLSKLLVAKDGAGYALLIESLIDGNMDLASLLDLDFFAKTDAATTYSAVADPANYADDVFGYQAFDDTTAVQFLWDSTELGYAGTLAAPPVVGDLYKVIVDGVSYVTTAGVTGASDAALIAALRTAVDAEGNKLTDKFAIVEDSANADDQGFLFVAREGLGTAGPGLDIRVVVADFAQEVTGTNEGTTSKNWVNGGAGDDVIVLNVGSDNALTNNDILVLDGLFGNDRILGFQTTFDKIDITALMKSTVTAGTFEAVAANNLEAAITQSNAGVLWNATMNHAAVANPTTGNTLNVTDFLATVATADANLNAVVFVNATGGSANFYTVFQVTNDGTAALTADEVRVLGTIQLETTTGFAAIAAGDLGINL